MLQERLKRIKVLIVDVDGVLTDGGIIIDSNGVETKRFDVQDGLGLMLWKKAGYRSAIISARPSDVVAHRAKDLGIDKYFVGVSPKVTAYDSLLKEWGIKDEEVCFVGDDVCAGFLNGRVHSPLHSRLFAAGCPRSPPVSV